MKTIVLTASVLLSGCFNDSDHPLDFEPNDVEVCTQGDAGRCCIVFQDLCSVLDEDCEPGGRFPRTPVRCNLCWPSDVDDGSRPPPPPGSPPPNPPPDEAVRALADGGTDDPRIEVCGPATYEKYEY